MTSIPVSPTSGNTPTEPTDRELLTVFVQTLLGCAFIEDIEGSINDLAPGEERDFLLSEVHDLNRALRFAKQRTDASEGGAA